MLAATLLLATLLPLALGYRSAPGRMASPCRRAVSVCSSPVAIASPDDVLAGGVSAYCERLRTRDVRAVLCVCTESAISESLRRAFPHAALAAADFENGRPGAVAIVFRDGTLDAPTSGGFDVVCVSGDLPRATLSSSLVACARAIKPAGVLVLLEPRPPSSLLVDMNAALERAGFAGVIVNDPALPGVRTTLAWRVAVVEPQEHRLSPAPSSRGSGVARRTRPGSPFASVELLLFTFQFALAYCWGMLIVEIMRDAGVL
ncbi:hypothetical protein JKP88DRAFT_273102 [Tribonema minus]|uniref:Methyltransferase type 11 domain-containing protein n=1 Tax=Tribonema minus TaxID=303371 RepID=A0A835Z148_9STRA|nr:hypothetical protein JKP88DRAFT_273102 [Tribonema minus]